MAPIDNVHGTLGLLKATKTQEYAEASSIAEELSGKGSFTMFAPSNDAWEELDPVSSRGGGVDGSVEGDILYHQSVISHCKPF